jgi:AraC-like DNA-binding protein
MNGPTASARLHHFGPPVPRQAHPQLHVLWSYEGTLELEIDGRAFRLAPWQATAIAPGRPHACHAPRGGRCFVAASSDAAHAAQVAPLCGQVRTADASMTHLLRYLAAHALLPASAGELLIDGLCTRSLVRAEGSRRPIAWATLEAWVDTHLAQPLSVATLAGQVHLSPTQFAARCREELGVTPMALVRRLRLQSALRLRHAGQGVAFVARQCGYRSPSALTAALRRERSW